MTNSSSLCHPRPPFLPVSLQQILWSRNSRFQGSKVSFSLSCGPSRSSLFAFCHNIQLPFGEKSKKLGILPNPPIKCTLRIVLSLSQRYTICNRRSLPSAASHFPRSRSRLDLSLPILPSSAYRSDEDGGSGEKEEAKKRASTKGLGDCHHRGTRSKPRLSVFPRE